MSQATEQIASQFANGANNKKTWGDVIYNVKVYDAKGDGITDDTAAIQKAFDAARTGGVVWFPPGVYITNGGAQLGDTAIAINDAKNVLVIGYGAELRQGSGSARIIGVYNSYQVTIEGLKLVGNIVHTGVTTSESYAGISINYSSRNVTIENCYITNFLGDCIYIGGSLVAGGETGYTTRNITIRGCVLKERYGNGVRAYDGGSRSRLAIAVIDTIGVKIENNFIYGGVDLEPNLDGQHIVSASVKNNTFLSGPVIPQAIIGTSYWYDEEIAAEGAAGSAEIEQTLFITGVAANPIVKGNAFSDNTFEKGTITVSNIYRADVVNNRFVKGLIIVGSTSGGNNTTDLDISNNTCDGPLTGENTFIKLDGFVTFCNFENNKCSIASGYCIANNGASTGDNGRNYLGNNKNRSATAAGVFNFPPLSASIGVGNWHNAGVADEKAKFERIAVREIRSDLITVNLTAVNQVIDYRTVGGNVWYLLGNNLSLAQVLEMPDGTQLTILSGASGGNNITIVHDAGKIRLKDGANFVMNNNSDSISFVARAGILFETSRTDVV